MFNNDLYNDREQLANFTNFIITKPRNKCN